MNFLLDTCAVLWVVAEPERISRHAQEMLTLDSSAVYVSPISAAEIACAVARERIRLDRHWRSWFDHYLELNAWRTVPIDLEIIEEAYSLPDEFHRDPADRIITATARLHSMTVVTGDQKILDYPHVRSIA